MSNMACFDHGCMRDEFELTNIFPSLHYENKNGQTAVFCIKNVGPILRFFASNRMI